MLSSIHFSIEALPFRLTSSHAFAVQRDCPSRAPMLRTCWVRQKSFAKWKLKKTRRAIRPPFVLRPSTSPAFVSPEKSILKRSARGWSTVVEAQRVHPAIKIGRAHVWTSVTKEHHVSRMLSEKK